MITQQKKGKAVADKNLKDQDVDDSVSIADKKRSSQSKSKVKAPLKKPKYDAQIEELSQQWIVQQEINKAMSSLPSLLQKLSDQVECLQNQSTGLTAEPTPQIGSIENDNFEDLLGSRANNDDGEKEIDEELLALLNAEEKDENLGADVNDAVAKRMNSIIEVPVTKEMLEKAKTRLLIPQNCKSLVVPKVNPEIWSQLSPRARANDIKSQISQSHHSKSLVAFTIIANEITKASKVIPTSVSEILLKACLDGSSFTSAAHQEISQKRKQTIKPFLSPQYGGICSSKPQTGQYLFGDNLQETLKASKAANDIVKRTVFTPRYAQHKSTFNYRPSLNFRGQSRMIYRGGYRGRPMNQMRYRSNPQTYRQKYQPQQ